MNDDGESSPFTAAAIAAVSEVLPPGPDARSMAESLLNDCGGDPSRALDRYFSTKSLAAADPSSRSSSTLSETKSAGSFCGKKRPRPASPFPKEAKLSTHKSPAQAARVPSYLSNSDKKVNPQSGHRSPSGPLAERVRPTELEQFLGQKSFGPDTPLGKLLAEDKFPSSILWGPPGCGKSTIGLLVCRITRRRCVKLSATQAGVKEVRSLVEESTNFRRLTSQGTVLFLDEIHRWNKTQQDALLPHVESGLITLLGATTENPSFSLNKALLSRCRVVVLDKLDRDSVVAILKAALANPRSGLPRNVSISDEVLTGLAGIADGDARAALNALELAIEISKPLGGDDGSAVVVSAEAAEKGLQRTHLLYDRDGEEHYNIISALHKSMRAGDVDASLYWLARMLEAGEDPRYVARQLVRFASEDVGLADPMALLQSTVAHSAAEHLGMPECDVVLAQATTFLARASKLVAVYCAYVAVKELVKKGPADLVPMHIRNAPTGLMKEVGCGKGYVYPPDNDYCRGCSEGLSFFPDNLKGTKLLDETEVEPGHCLHPK